ncbi:SF1B family DNA helicase RecD2 [Spiroplasma tabanidicola]|uniref:Exodeoxyribonuclease V alpha subunit n=1 Tax=Spiroplasma tabanidicola TaxID=324079 RepID=A0A6I6C4Z7_9MOLU|nr:AAA family ATPase [Spiroplasma tabanidicola]QGS51907.1 exodeoxyribonuclease V alpha subunit [Spiroplasma tabanidicola]
MTEIKGKIKSFIFNNESFGIAVFTLMDNDTRSIVIKGEITSMRLNVFYCLNGETVIDRKTNKTVFEVKSLKQIKITSKELVIKYLCSPLFPTVGKKLASNIYEHFGDDTFNKILSNPEEIKNVKDIKDSQVLIILETLKENFEENKVLEIFEEHNLKLEFYTRVEKFCKSKEEIKNTFENNFFEFAENNFLIPFKEVDRVALAFGLEENSSERISWWAKHLANELLMKTGNTYLELSIIKKELQKVFFNINYEIFDEKLIYAKKNKLLIFENKKVYTKESYNDEVVISKSLLEIENKIKITKKTNLEDYLKEVESFVETSLNIKNFKYNQEQKLALENFLNNNVSIVTGGPGTGKTTVIIGLVKLYELVYKKNDFAIVAPTGRAASRINEVSNYEATTIHRLLKYTGNNTFEYNDLNKLDRGMLIIDESSMIDNHLFASIFLGLENLNKIVLVGDIDQLPSVSYGNAFEDIIKSNCFSLTKLITNNRQIITGERNSIIDLANCIKNNNIELFDFDNTNNIDFIFENDANYALEKIKDTYLNNRPIDFEEEILNLQIVAPMYKNNLGIDRINNFIQSIVNVNKKNIYKRGEVEYKANDKIMYTENDSYLKVFNGDVGYIQEIILENKKFKIAKTYFNKELKELNSSQFGKVKLNYACSIHKTQGSEYDKVILVLDNTNQYSSFLINKKMIYTAITRAKKHLFIIGDKKLFINSCKKEMKERLTTLKDRIVQLID